MQEEYKEAPINPEPIISEKMKKRLAFWKPVPYLAISGYLAMNAFGFLVTKEYLDKENTTPIEIEQSIEDYLIKSKNRSDSFANKMVHSLESASINLSTLGRKIAYFTE